MPPGICANQSPNFPSSGAARRTMLTVDPRLIFPVPNDLKRQIRLSGIADATYRGINSEADFDKIKTNVNLNIDWHDAVFFGYDKDYGPVFAEVEPSPGTTGQSTGVMRSNQANTTPNNIGLSNFLPAVSTNYFKFKLHMPKFGLILESKDIVENSAQVTQLPPLESVFRLTRPITYKPNRKESKGFISTIKSNSVMAAIGGKLLKNVTIQSCDVSFVTEGGIGIELTLIEDDIASRTVRFSVKLTNLTDHDEIDVNWLVWPRPITQEMKLLDIFANIPLKRQPVIKEIKLNRNIFHMTRWLVVVAAGPENLDASMGARFPSIA